MSSTTVTPRESGGVARPPALGPHVALLLPSLAGGGAERSLLRLADAFAARGCRVDVVVCRAVGPYRNEVPPGIRLVPLQAAWSGIARLCALRADPEGIAALARPVLLPWKSWPRLGYLPDLVRYLKRERPDALLAATTRINVLALWARRLARAPVRVVISERNQLSESLASSASAKTWRKRYAGPLVRRVYRWADAITAVSNGVAEDLAAFTSLPPERIVTIYNPSSSPALVAAAQAAPEHPWFGPGASPVVLAAGRLEPQKDFATLLRAFARVRRRRDVRLAVLGEGRQRAALQALARELAVDDAVDMPGFVANPWAYMARAALFVLSSRFEGFSNVLVEAMTCGCPVVSTDCPSGPAEILGGGQYGKLVPVGDAAALADAIEQALDDPPDRARLQARAQEFSVERARDRYLALLVGMQGRPQVAGEAITEPGREAQDGGGST